MESVAAERLNKLGKNPSIISTRHDLKRDAAVLKDLITRATPQPSDDDNDDDNQEEEELEEDEEQTSSSVSSISSQENRSKYSLEKGFDRKYGEKISQEDYLNKKRRKRQRKVKRKSSSTEKKFQKLSRLFLAAPSTTFNSSTHINRNQLRKSPSTPWSLFRKTNSLTPSLSNQSPS